MAALSLDFYCLKSSNNKDFVRFPLGILSDFLADKIDPNSASFCELHAAVNKIIRHIGGNSPHCNIVCVGRFATLQNIYVSDMRLAPRDCSSVCYKNHDFKDTELAAKELRRILITALNYLFPRQGSLYNANGIVLARGKQTTAYQLRAIDIVNDLMSTAPSGKLVKFSSGMIYFTPNTVDTPMLTWLVYIAMHMPGTVFISAEGIYHENGEETVYFQTLYDVISFASANIQGPCERRYAELLPQGVDLRVLMGVNY